jgi:hypothetical protein
MTTRFWYQGDSAAVEITRVRLSPEHRGSGWRTTCRLGESASALVMVDDPDGTLTFVPWRRFWITEDEAPTGKRRLWMGYITAVRVRRRDHYLGPGRVWELELYDINSILHHRILLPADNANRPAETDIQRLDWLLGTNWANGVIYSDLGLVDRYDAVQMDAHDYTGSYFSDVLADLSNASGKNHFLVYHEEADHRDLFYARNNSDLWDSGVTLTNRPEAANWSTGWIVGHDAEWEADGSRMYTGLWVPYSGGTLYRTRTLDPGEVPRDGVSPASEVKTQATAQGLADRELAELKYPDEKARCWIWVPRDKATIIRPGQRVQVDLSHLPTTSTYGRVIEHEISQPEQGQSDDYYRVAMEIDLPPSPCTVMGYRYPTGVNDAYISAVYDVPVHDTPTGFYPPLSIYGRCNGLLAGCVSSSPDGLYWYSPGIAGGCAQMRLPIGVRPAPNAHKAVTGICGGGQWWFDHYGQIAPDLPLGWGDGGMVDTAPPQLKLEIWLIGPGRIKIWFTRNAGAQPGDQVSGFIDLFRVDMPVPAQPSHDVYTKLQTVPIVQGSVTLDVPNDGACAHKLRLYDGGTYGDSWTWGGFRWTLMR